MASRNPRARLGAAPGARGPCRPGTTRAHALRQAKSAAIVNARPEPPPGPAPCPPRRVRTNLARVGVSPPEPKRIDFTRPGLTKAMMARLQHSQRLKETQEQKRRQEEASMRRPRRTAAPVGGDARMGRERPVQKQWQPQGVLQQEVASRSPTIRRMMQEDYMHPPKGPGRRGPGGLSGMAGPSGVAGPSRAAGPSGPGRRSHSTGAPAKAAAAEAANRSIQVIQETLDEQDAVECITVQNKLQDLQMARRDFVMAVANVSGNAVSLADEVVPSFSPSSLTGSPVSYQHRPLPSESPQRYLYKLPDLDDPCLQVDYDRHQATLATGRQFLERREAAEAQREAQRRIDEEFARAATHIDDDLRFDFPIEQDIMEGDISFEEDEDGTIFPCQSRIRASMPPIPQRDDHYFNYRSADIEELERFFDTTNYPPIIASTCHERHGRNNINPDLWELEDPWYYPPPEPIGDLMEFDLMEFSP